MEGRVQRARKFCNGCSKWFTDAARLSRHACVDQGESGDENESKARKASHADRTKTFSGRVGASKENVLHRGSGTAPNQCANCGKTFSSRLKLSQHVCMKGKEEGRARQTLKQCQHCKKSFSNTILLAQHTCRKINDGGRSVKKAVCQHCKISFTNDILLRQHTCKRVNDSGRSIRKSEPVCKHCKKPFSSILQLARHTCMGVSQTEDDGGRLPHQCTGCQKRFWSIPNLAKHKCTRSNANKAAVNTHTNIKAVQGKNGNKIIKVESRKKITEVKSSNVSQVKSGEKSKQRNATSSSDKYKQSQAGDVGEVETVPRLREQCKQCRKWFNNKVHLSRHPCCQEEQCYHCDECGEDFSNLVRLNSHPCYQDSGEDEERRAEERERPPAEYRCEKCGSLFSDAVRLSKHSCRAEKCDNSENGTECSEEGNFNNSVQVEVKLVEFDNDWVSTKDADDDDETDRMDKSLYNCPDCDRQFVREGNLARHMNTHKHGEEADIKLARPKSETKSIIDNSLEATLPKHKCDICGKQYTREATFTKHMQTHNADHGKGTKASQHLLVTDSQTYKCLVCGRQYAQETKFKKHVETHKDEESWIKLEELEEDEDSEFEAGSNDEERVEDHELEEAPKYKCHVCFRQFAYKRNLSRHLELHQQEEEEEEEASLVDDEEVVQVQEKNMKIEEGDMESKVNVGKMSKMSHSGKKSGKTARPYSEKGHYLCSKCPKTFNYKSKFVNHVRTHEEDGSFQCQECSRIFTHKKNLQNHLRIHQNLECNKCEECSNSNINEKKFQTHTKSHQGKDKNCICSECGKTFTHPKKPTKLHQDQGTYKCPECNKTFLYEKSYLVHARLHQEKGNHTCEVCSRVFIFEKRLLNHMKTHHEEDQYKCSECDKTFIHAKSFLNHKKLHSAEKDKAHTCQQCSRTFTYEKNLDKHNNLYHEIGNYECSHCSLTFEQKILLQEHSVTHEENLHGCSKCPLWFSTKGGLSRHKRSHLSSLNCSVCDKLFTHRKDLTKHEKTHGGRIHACHLCPKAFKTIRCLNKHLVRHESKVATVWRNTNVTYYPLGDGKNSNLSENKVKHEVNPETSKVHVFDGIECEVAAHEIFSSGDVPTMESIGQDGKGGTNEGILSAIEIKGELDREKQFSDNDQVRETDVDNADGENVNKVGVPVLGGLKINVISGRKMQSGLNDQISKRKSGSRIVTSTIKREAELKSIDDNDGVSDTQDTRASVGSVEGENIGVSNIEGDKSNIGVDRDVEDSGSVSKEHHCGECGAEFEREIDFMRHALTHTELGWEVVRGGVCVKYQCGECGRVCADKTDITRHVFTHVKVRNFTCPVCQKTFCRKMALDDHLVIHTGEKRFECVHCKRLFVHRSHYSEHLLSHTGVKKYTCPLCPMKFIRKAYLDRHSVVHTGLQPHQCYECGRNFRYTSSLREHLRQHTGKKRECPICAKPIAFASGLHRHMQTHTNTKRYQCHICGKQFIQNKHLANHILKHSNPKTKRNSTKKRKEEQEGETVKVEGGEKVKKKRRKREKNIEKTSPATDSERTSHKAGKRQRSSNSEKRKQLIKRRKRSAEVTPPTPVEYIVAQNEDLSDSWEPVQKPTKVDYLCPHCYQPFSDITKLTSHLQSHLNHSRMDEELDDTLSDFDPLDNSMEDQQEEQQQERHQHHHKKQQQQIVSVNRTIDCPVCERQFMKDLTSTHILIHTEVARFPCKTCGRKFRKEKELVEHQEEGTCVPVEVRHSKPLQETEELCAEVTIIMKE